MNNKKIAIVGSRRRKDKETVEKLVNKLPKDSVVISGGCKGVDTWAIDIARKRGLKTIVHLPTLIPGKTYIEYVNAYYTRTRLIAEEADIVYAFVSDNRKGGTENTIKYARQFDKKVVIM